MSGIKWINYQHLFYFKTIAQEGGVAKAAEKLRLGQPTLSIQMKVFEENLGHKLFDRSHKRLMLTEGGRLVLGYANEIFRLGNEMIDSLEDRYGSLKLSVQIGLCDFLPKRLGTKVFEEVLSIVDCTPTLVSGHNDHLLRELKAHHLDIVLSNEPPPISEGSKFYAKNIAKLKVYLCGAPAFAGLKDNFPQSLIGAPFLMPGTHSRLHQSLSHYLKNHHLNVHLVAKIEDTSIQKMLAAAGKGLIAMSELAVKEYLKKGELIQIDELEGVYEEIWLVFAERRIDNPVAAALLKNLHF